MQNGQGPRDLTSEEHNAGNAHSLLSYTTERMRTDEALCKERDFTSAVLDTAGALVVVLDREGRIVRFNRACERTTGYSLDEVRGRLLWDLFVIPDEVKQVKAVFEELQAGQFPNEHENYWLTKDGDRRLVAWSNTAILGTDGTVEYVVGTGLDVTERRQAESERDATLEALKESHQALELRVAERTAELQEANEALQQEVLERKQVEDALRQSEGHMRSLMESARSYAVYRIAVDPANPFLGRVILASPSMKDLLSILDLSDFSTWFDMIHPDDLERVVEANRRSLEDGAPFDQQFRTLKEERGEWNWVHVRSTPVLDSEGRLTHFNGLVVDVTEQKRAEQALRDSELRFRAVFEGAPIGVSVTSLEAQLLETNRALQQMFGYSSEEFYNLPVPEFSHPEDMAVDADIFFNELVPGKRDGYQMEKRFIRKNGEMFWGRLSMSLARAESGEPLFAIATTEDITERKQAEEALRESEEKSRGIVEYANVGIAIIQDACFRLVNPHFAAMLGYTVEDMVGTEFMDYFPPEECDRVVDLYTRRIRGEPVTPRYETVMLHRSGVRVHAGVSAGVIPYGGRPATFVFVRDITEQKQAQQAIEEAYRTLEQRVEERTRELRTLLEVSKNLVSTLELEPLLASILDELRSVVDYEGCMVYTLEGDKLVPRAHWGQMPRDETMALRYGVDDPLDRLVLGGGEPVLVSDTLGDSPTAQAYRESVGALQESLYPHIRSWLGVPLIVKGQVIGELALEHSEPDHFSPAHARLAMAFANQAAAAIENARLYGAEQERREESERRREVAEGLREILAILNSRQSLNDMLDLIATQACRVLGSDAAALLRLDRAAGQLAIQATCQLDPEHAARVNMPLGVGTAGRALAERRPVVISDTAEAAAYLETGGTDRPELDHALLEQLVNRYCALFSVPIVVKDEAYGALTFYYRDPHSCSEEEFRLALSVADQAALALESARLREQAEQAAAMEERGRLARELHDSVTQSLYSVTMYAEAAARMMNTSPEAAAEHLREARDTAQEALREMRLLIYQLRPPVVAQGGLAVALQLRLDAVERRGGIRADLLVEGHDRLSPGTQAELYQIAQEALNNALKHAHAGQVHVRLHLGDAETHLEIQDDGVGFDLAAAQAGGGLGLPGMRERLQELGGRLEINTAPGQGTKVVVEVPSGGEG
jgi:PAS domain S-box-containing protein